MNRRLKIDPSTFALYVAALCLFGLGAILICAGAAS